jgi:hypothetical protein
MPIKGVCKKTSRDAVNYINEKGIGALGPYSLENNQIFNYEYCSTLSARVNVPRHPPSPCPA